MEHDANDKSVKKKVQLELELETKTTDTSKNPFQTIIDLAKAVDAWRIFPRIFISVYIYLLYRSIVWFMALPNPTVEQAGLISVMTGVGAAWFGMYTKTRGDGD